MRWCGGFHSYGNSAAQFCCTGIGAVGRGESTGDSIFSALLPLIRIVSEQSGAAD